MTELELLHNIRAAKDYNDRESFNRLIQHFDVDLRRVAYGILRSQSAMDDALQIAYFKAYQSLTTLHRPTSFGPWLRRIVVTTCLDQLRAQNRRNEVGLDAIPVSAPFDSFEAGVDIQHSLDRAMNKLSDHHRILIELIDGQAMSYKEVASILHKRPGTITSRTSRARKQLRKHLQEEGVET